MFDELLARVMDARERMSRARRHHAGADQDRARPHAERARRHRRRRTPPPGRRHDRRQHHDLAAAGLRDPAAREAGGLSGRPLFALVDAHAGGDLCAGRGRVPAHRRRRHRFGRRPRSPRSGPARRSCSSTARWSSAGCGSSPSSRPTFRRRSNSGGPRRHRRTCRHGRRRDDGGGLAGVTRSPASDLIRHTLSGHSRASGNPSHFPDACACAERTGSRFRGDDSGITAPWRRASAA